MTSSHPLKILSPCPYFHACGGCDFLDLSEESYRHLKKQSLEKYLINLGLEPRWLWVGVNSRRKINLQISDKNVVGFFSEKSNSIVEIEKCLTAEKEISELILPLKNFFKSQEQNLFTQVSITLFDSGPDLIFSSKKPLNFSQTQKLTTFAKEKNFNISSRVKNDISPIFLVRKNQIFYHDFNPDPSLEFKKNFAKREQLEGNFASRTVSVPRYVRNAEAQNSIPDAMLSRNFAEENLHENVPVSKMASKPTGSDSGENQIRSNDGSGLNGAVLSISPQRKSSKKLQSSASPDHLRPPLSIFFSTPVAPLETANPSPPAPNSVITNRIAEKILALKESAKEKKR